MKMGLDCFHGGRQVEYSYTSRQVEEKKIKDFLIGNTFIGELLSEGDVFV